MVICFTSLIYHTIILHVHDAVLCREEPDVAIAVEDKGSIGGMLHFRSGLSNLEGDEIFGTFSVKPLPINEQIVYLWYRLTIVIVHRHRMGQRGKQGSGSH